MAQKCEICGKGPQFGHNVSHSQRKTAKMWSANIQTAKLMIDGKPRKVKLCAKCIKDESLVRAI